MIRDWLDESERTQHNYKYKIIDITEKNIRQDPQFSKWLASEILCAYTDPSILKQRYGNRDKSYLRSYLENTVFPPLNSTVEKNTRRGDWGEIITGLVLRDIRSIETSLIKLRYKLNHKKSSFGIDVFGVQFDHSGTVTGICVCETKTKITYDKHIGKKAYESLSYNDTNSIATIASFLSNRYYEMGDYEKAQQFDEIICEPTRFPTNHSIFLIHEKSLWKDEILDELEKVNLSYDVFFNIVLVDKLNDFANDTISLIPDVGEEIVYGSN